MALRGPLFEQGSFRTPLGEWYAFRNVPSWATDLLVEARAGGATVSSLTLARCYWHLRRTAEAGSEFERAIAESKDAQEKFYLQLCLAASSGIVDGKPVVPGVPAGHGLKPGQPPTRRPVSWSLGHSLE